MTWSKLPALEHGGLRSGSLTCGTQPIVIEMDAPLCVGCGCVIVTKDGSMVWGGDDEAVTMAQAEQWASADPDHDWRVAFDGPLNNATYQRHGAGQWVLVEKGRGFA